MTTFRLQNNSTSDNAALHKIKNQKKDVMKPKRKRITTEQLHLLSDLFQQTDTPGHDLREKLAKKLDMTNREVQVWFQNRRAKVNRMRLQQQQQQQRKPYDQWPTSSSSSSSSVCSTPSSPIQQQQQQPQPQSQQYQYQSIYNNTSNLSPIDILASAAAYVQQWDEEEQQRKQQIQEPKKHKSWRPWL